MKIIVCLKEVIDPALNLDFGLSNSVVFREGLPLRLNPGDAAALAMALALKSPSEETTEITVVSIGAERVESYLRNALAVGADKAVRIWDGDFTELIPYQKAIILSGFASLSNADLVLLGSRSLDTTNGQVGPMLAARLGLPCVCDAVGIELDEEQNSVSLIKDIGRGEREKVRCSLPAVVTVKDDGKLKLPYAALDRLIDSKSAKITLHNPADLGISADALKNAPSRISRLTFPRPHPVKAPPLDSSLPAFYRILQLLEGGISKRKGRMLEGSPDELAEQLFQLFLEEGVIKKAGK